jgi:alkaline phosphatase D
MNLNRRELFAAALAIGANAAWADKSSRSVGSKATESRSAYPHGVASGDPYPDSIVLWTRHPASDLDGSCDLAVEVAEDSQFQLTVVTAKCTVKSASDWTCRVLVGGLRPSTRYWYRFVDEDQRASRIGRTMTAPGEHDGAAVRFVYMSCQDVCLGAQNAYRKLLWEEEHTPEAQQIQFVLHLGDYVYEIVTYPEDEPLGRYGRRFRDLVRYPSGERHDEFHVPTTVEDYRCLYRAYLLDPDIQDARARWPFVCMWDNHEFSWRGWQSQQDFGKGVRPAQTRKVAASQAWFEYQPARVARVGDVKQDRFQAPAVVDAPISNFDEHGLGLEPNNLVAIYTLILNRTLRFGQHVELILTDNRSYRSACVADRAEVARFESKAFPYFLPEEVIDILDAGRSYSGGKPPTRIRVGATEISNFRASSPPQSMLGVSQKQWLLERLASSTATWKLWGNTVAMLDWRTDLHRLPSGTGAQWPGRGYGILSIDDWGGYRTERGEILDFLQQRGITGMISLAGDRHAFFAGLLSKELPPKAFEPVAIEFVVGSVSAPGLMEAAEYGVPKDHPLRALYVAERTPGVLQSTLNMSALHGVRSSLTMSATGDVAAARRARNPEVAPHLSFADAGGHGYCMVEAEASKLSVTFVGIPRPAESAPGPEGGPLAYRVRHTVQAWTHGARPSLRQELLDGELPLAT